MKELVSVIVASFNHERWIKKCIESIIDQKTSYKYKIYIHDDASNDGSGKIIKSYAAKYPDLIVALCSDENKLSKGIDPFSDILLPLTNGKYIMICEGDDYWVNKYKIQIQIDYMEAHPNCKFSFGNAYRVDTDGNILSKFFPEIRWKDKIINKKIMKKMGCNLSTEEMIFLDFIPTASICFYKRGYEITRDNFSICMDITLRLVNSDIGEYSHYFNDIFSAYRTGNPLSASGSISGSKEQMLNAFFQKHKKILNEFDNYSGGKYRAVIDHEIKRKHLTVYLNTDIAAASKMECYDEVPFFKKIKEYLRKYCHPLFKILKKIKYGKSKIKYNA